jgi:histidinol-phosphate aminotransferase
VRQVWWPDRAYGDYRHAAEVAGLGRAAHPAAAGLVWCCEPASPTGDNEPWLGRLAELGGQVVLDAAYEPLRLSGERTLDARRLDRVWQLWTPNKALGLTGVRAAYALAPAQDRVEADALDSAAPSWVLGGEGVALLTAWTRPDVQAWRATSLDRLREWKRQQLAWLADRGWSIVPGHTPFFCVKPPHPIDGAALRAAGLALRDASSLGMPGWWRMAVLPPAATAALDRVLGGRPAEFAA